jgi:hypothetical protein
MDWRDLDTRGYVVRPQFVEDSEIDELVAGFELGKPAGDYQFGFKVVGRRALRVAWRCIEPVLKDVRRQTSIDVDELNFLTRSHYITTRHTERSSHLHQDFDLDYKLTGDHHNYLNFWVPLRKPARELSNVTLIPFDRLRARAPAVYENFVGSGGNRFVVEDDKTVVFGRYGSILSNDEKLEPDMLLDFPIDELATTPELAAGDALVMRGDVIHRTQDSSTERLAISIRVTSSAKIIKRERTVFDGSGATQVREAASLGTTLRSCFETLNRSEVTIADFMAFATKESRGGPRS